MTMHPDTRAPIPHVERLAHHIDAATRRVRIIEAAPDWPAPPPRDDEQDGAMALAAYVVIAMSAAFGLLAYVALRVAEVV